MSKKIAETIAVRSGIEYNDETLTDVLNAVRGPILSDIQLVDILKREFCGVTPVAELSDLLKISWRRVYTWNIDDALENIGESSQRIRHYNGIVDKVADFEGPAYLHIVHLHGQITKPEHGFILSETEYSQAVIGTRHYWYQRAAQDYLAFCPIFVGTQLDEPILVAQLERAKRDSKTAAGKAFLVTPDSLSPIKKAGLEAKGIIHLRGTLEEFSRWLRKEFPVGVSPKAIVSGSRKFTNLDKLDLSAIDINTAHSLRPIKVLDIRAALRQLSHPELSEIGRRFLRGHPPTWRITASAIPVWLDDTNALYRSMGAAIGRGDRLFVVRGQSGSGKTTATMMALLKYMEENPEVLLYEMLDDVKSVRAVFDLLDKIHGGKRCVVYAGDIFLFGDSFKFDLEQLAGRQVTIVSTARSGEWNENFARHLGSVCTPYLFQRFSERDYEPLIKRLIEYVPAPSFRRLNLAAQRAKLASSRSQLLIALREATESENFADIITSEFEKLPDADTRRLFVVAALATIARVGISSEAAREAYVAMGSRRSFDDALAALDGIVNLSEKNRLLARHELYARHVVEKVVGFNLIKAALISVFKTYIKYSTPIIRSVSRQDAHLFKFLLNHNFIKRICQGNRAEAVAIYEEFEVDFQMDGHYWLQYGLYCAEIGEIEEALKMLRRSIQAYPENAYAVHAHAHLQLRLAEQRASYDVVTQRLIGEAVEMLKLQDARPDLQMDEYPIVTLALGHVGALLKHGQQESAKRVATQYFDRIQQVEKQIPVRAIKMAKEQMMKFVVLGEWNARPWNEISSEIF